MEGFRGPKLVDCFGNVRVERAVTPSTPPRRESIADTSRRHGLGGLPSTLLGRSALPCPLWKTLFEEALLAAQTLFRRLAVEAGAGVSAPIIYRSLLEAITLKLNSVKHWSGWLFPLWLRGREYRIEDVRRALIDEVHAAIHLVKKDFAPTGRFTEPFGFKFERRVRQPEESDPELSDFLEPVIAKIILPDAISEIAPNIKRMTGTTSRSQRSESTLRPAVSELVEALRHSAPSRESGKPSDLSKMDPHSRAPSTTVTEALDSSRAIRAASENDLLRVRNLWAAISSGKA